MVEVAEKVGGRDSHHFKFVQVPFNLGNPELFVEDECQYMPLCGNTRTGSLIKVAEELGVNVLTSNSLASGDMTNIERIPGCYGRDPVSSLLHFYKSVNSEMRTPNWAGAAFNSNNLLNFQRNLNFLRIDPMSESDIRQ